MIKNKFDILFETAYSHYSNGGFRENSVIKIKPSFLKSEFFKKFYSGNEVIASFIKQLVDTKSDLFIKRVVGNSNIDPRGGSVNGDPYLIIQTDPRIIEFPVELTQFKVPCDWDYIENCDYGINLPPVQGVPNKYEKVQPADKGTEWVDTDNIDNKSKDRSLPKKNVKI